MKTTIFQNWFKLMIGTSALIVSVSFLIRSITPVYANNPSPSNVAGTNGYVEGGYVYFIGNDNWCRVKLGQMDKMWKYSFSQHDFNGDGEKEQAARQGFGKPLQWLDLRTYKIINTTIIQDWDIQKGLKAPQ